MASSDAEMDAEARRGLAALSGLLATLAVFFNVTRHVSELGPRAAMHASAAHDLQVTSAFRPPRTPRPPHDVRVPMVYGDGGGGAGEIVVAVVFGPFQEQSSLVNFKKIMEGGGRGNVPALRSRC